MGVKQVVRQTDSHFRLCVDDLINSYALKGIAVELVVGPRHNIWHVHGLQQDTRHDTGNQIGANGDNRGVIVVDTQLPENSLVGPVAGDRMGDLAHDLLDAVLVGVHGQYVMAQIV